MRFVGIFFAVFITLTMTIVMSGGSHEMFAYAFYANLYYAVIGGVGWYLTDRFIGTGTLSRLLASILLGLIVLNLIPISFGSSKFLTLALFKTPGQGQFAVSLCTHMAFLISFLVAYIDKRRQKNSVTE